MEKLRVQWGMDACLIMDSVGRAGGLAMLWMSEVNLEIVSFSCSHIDAKVLSDEGSVRYHLTGFYGAPDHSKRKKSWELLKHLAGSNSTPWLIFGDFNELIESGEKCGGPLRNVRQMEEFREAIEVCFLVNIPILGPLFTWSRSYGDEVVFERLDRGPANASWWSLFPHTCEYHLVSSHSDHCPLFFTYGDVNLSLHGKGKPFRFENMWIREESCREVIEATWNSRMVNDINGLADQIVTCGEALSNWNKSTFGNVQKQIREKKKELE